MANWAKSVMALTLALLLMLAIRALAFSVHTVDGNALAPLFNPGDHLLVNRCSYGLRIAGNGLLPYSRLMRSPVRRGDIVAFIAPDGKPSGLMIARCAATPGDTIRTVEGTVTVPGLMNCAKADYYWLEPVNASNPADSHHLGFIPESHIIGRVVGVVFNRKQIRLQ